MDMRIALETVILVAIAAGVIAFSQGISKAHEYTSDTFSDYNIKRGYMYEIVSAPCLNDVVIARPEHKKFIMDRSKLDKEQKGVPDISCLNITRTKYRIHIIDIPTGKIWLLTNYLPVKYTHDTYRTPELEHVVQINDYTTPPISEEALIDFDLYKKALVSASFTLGEGLNKMPDEMFCERDPDNRQYIAGPFSDNHGPIKEIYHYPDNNCMSGNCIKGSGQSYATCQPAENTYDGISGACETGYQCISLKCESGNCIDENPPDKVYIGQLCMDIPPLTLEETCITGHCKYDIMCACTDDSQCEAPEVCNIEKGVCL